MKIKELSIKGAFIIELDRHIDDRGFFIKYFSKNEMLDAGIKFDVKQCALSQNNKAGTLRGLHFQPPPFPETKIVTCLEGACFDVMVDVDKNSPTYLKWEACELTEDNNTMLFVPASCAHGFQTLQDNTTIHYQIDGQFNPKHSIGFMWNDPKIGVKWPECKNIIINDRDKNHELL